MLTEFNKGGSHEENKYGGIPQGFSNNGQMNTVEEGETKHKNYVYSDRLYLNEDLLKEMNLPSYLKGKSFANASKAINNKFKDRNDIHSKSTEKELLKRLTDSQEYLKQKEQTINNSLNINKQEIDYPSQKFDEGGFINLFNNLGNSITSAINPNGYNGNDIINSNMKGFDNKHLKMSNNVSNVLDNIENTVANNYGPVGSAVFSAKKLGENIGGAIGGKGGAAISSIFSPEKSAITNLTDSSLNIGQKALGILPGIGGIISKTSSDKKLNKFIDDKNRAENFYKYQYNENNDDTKSFSEGGPLDPPTKINRNDLVKITVNDIKTPNPSSTYLNIVGMQKGVNHPKLGNGAYFYSGKTPLDPGFDPNVNREFIKQDAIQDYLNSEQGKKYQENLKNQINLEQSKGLPIYSYSYLKPNQFADGGEIINQYPKNEIDTYLEEKKPFPYFDDNYNRVMNPNYINYSNNLKAKGLNLNESNLDQSSLENTNNKLDKSTLLNNIGNNLLRYSPIIGNMIQKNNMGPLEVENAIKNNYKYKKQYLDNESYQNASKQQSANTIEALSKAGISGNQLVSSMLGSQLNRTKSIAEGELQSKLHNINENKLYEQVEQQNQNDYINDIRRINDINAQNRANYDTQRSKFDSQISNDLGNIGKEEMFKKMAEKITGYDWLGNYLKENPNSNIDEAIKEFEKKGIKRIKTFENKYGGYVNLNFKK